MYRADSHLHSLHSFDSAAPMEAQCEAACAAGMEEICFTEHFSVNPLVPTYGYLDRARYDADYAACRGAFAGRLRVYKGIELCEPHRYAERYRELFARGPVDAVVGSVHNVDNGKLRALVRDEGPDRACERYFSELRDMAGRAEIDVAAHFDLVKRYIGAPFTEREVEHNLRVIGEILQILVERGIALELNGSTLGSLGQLMPCEEIVRLYAQKGGRLAHLRLGRAQPRKARAGLCGGRRACEELRLSGILHLPGAPPVFHPFEDE